MKTAHRCCYCGRVSRNVTRFYDAGAICGTERYACFGWKACKKRQQAKGKSILEFFGMANPPSKRKPGTRRKRPV